MRQEDARRREQSFKDTTFELDQYLKLLAKHNVKVEL
jgi:hypothetical protein